MSNLLRITKDGSRSFAEQRVFGDSELAHVCTNTFLAHCYIPDLTVKKAVPSNSAYFQLAGVFQP